MYLRILWLVPVLVSLYSCHYQLSRVDYVFIFPINPKYVGSSHIQSTQYVDKGGRGITGIRYPIIKWDFFPKLMIFFPPAFLMVK